MKGRVNGFVDLFPGLYFFFYTEQIVLLAYFHAIEEGRESVNKNELERLFALAGTPVPKNLKQLFDLLCVRRARS